jgi:hypothetical protein
MFLIVIVGICNIDEQQAVFSMGFFEFQPGDETKPDQWRVATEIWMFWVVAGLLTGLTILAWMVWNRKLSQKSLFGLKWEHRINNLRGKPRTRT